MKQGVGLTMLWAPRARSGCIRGGGGRAMQCCAQGMEGREGGFSHSPWPSSPSPTSVRSPASDPLFYCNAGAFTARQPGWWHRDTQPPPAHATGHSSACSEGGGGAGERGAPTHTLPADVVVSSVEYMCLCRCVCTNACIIFSNRSFSFLNNSFIDVCIYLYHFTNKPTKINLIVLDKTLGTPFQNKKS